jgi:ribosome-binding factor A
MASYRHERIAELVHRELAERLRTEIKDDRLALLSITLVEVTRDLSRATAHYMPLGGGTITEDLQDALDDAAKKLRGPIGRALGIRRAPELVFKPDTHTEEAARMTRLLTEIGRELRHDDASEGEE